MTTPNKNRIQSHKEGDNSPDLADALASTDDGHEMGLLRTKRKVINTNTHTMTF